MGTTSGSSSRRSALHGGAALGLGVVAQGLPSAAAASSLGSDVAGVTVEGGTTSTSGGFRFHTFGVGDHTLTVSGGEADLDTDLRPTAPPGSGRTTTIVPPPVNRSVHGREMLTHPHPSHVRPHA